MTTINRTVETEEDRLMAGRLIENRPIPFTLSLTDGKHRTTAQNKLQRLWMNEISQQRGDMTPEEARAYCKLTIGVPILRAENEAFRIRYDEVVKPLPYEKKIAFMAEPLDLPVTRLMTTKQKTDYLDGIVRHFAEQGIILTMPEDMKHESGDLPLAGTADEPAVLNSAGSTEEAAPSSSVDSHPDASDTEGGPASEISETADGQSRQVPTSAVSRDAETETLIQFAKDVLQLAASEGTTRETLKAVEGEYSARMKALSDDGYQKARSISSSARAILEGNTSIESAVEFFSERLVCEPAEIGG